MPGFWVWEYGEGVRGVVRVEVEMVEEMKVLVL